MASLIFKNLGCSNGSRVVLNRYFSTTCLLKCQKLPSTSVNAASEGADSKFAVHKHKVNNLERRMLVWTGKYKNVNDVPPTVAPETMEKARNKVRIRLANYMMAATLVACLLMVFSGKKAMERGESVHKANIEWHKRVKEEEEKQKQKSA